MPTPIFALGKHRSGTTWLGNQLCQHPLIAGVTHERHKGIHESAYFCSIYNRYGNLGIKANYMEFVEVIGASDYFRLAGISKEFLYSLFPTTYEEVFRIAMDNYAAKQGAAFWVEKSPAHTLEVELLATLYPDAKFIAIIRDLESVTASTLYHTEPGAPDAPSRQRHLISTVLNWTHYNKVIKTFHAKSDRMLLLRYKALRSDLKSVMQQICAFLEVDFDPAMCKQTFVPNSSFQTQKRDKALSVTEKKQVKLISGLANLIPLNVINYLYEKARRNKRQSLPWWFFKLHEFNNNGSELFNEELKSFLKENKNAAI